MTDYQITWQQNIFCGCGNVPSPENLRLNNSGVGGPQIRTAKSRNTEQVSLVKRKPQLLGNHLQTELCLSYMPRGPFNELSLNCINLDSWIWVGTSVFYFFYSYCRQWQLLQHLYYLYKINLKNGILLPYVTTTVEFVTEFGLAHRKRKKPNSTFSRDIL